MIGEYRTIISKQGSFNDIINRASQTWTRLPLSFLAPDVPDKGVVAGRRPRDPCNKRLGVSCRDIYTSPLNQSQFRNSIPASHISPSEHGLFRNRARNRQLEPSVIISLENDYFSFKKWLFLLWLFLYFLTILNSCDVF